MNLTILILIKKIINTFLTPKIKFFYYNYDKKFIKNNKNRIVYNILGRIWFFPINIMSRYWHNIIQEDNHNYKKYNKIDKSAQILLKKVIKFSNKKNDKILDLGCNVGRHLNFLKKNNFKQLYGVDICKLSIKKSTQVFPNLKKINLKCASFENYLVNTLNDEFDIIYTHGATVELIKPTFPLIAELSRVTKKYIILLINENGQKYPRFWRFEFNFNSLNIEHYKILKNGHTLFVLKKLNDKINI
tara:strand:+ start:1402 stop:2136 length:735 start_codon:yes stop_codon:yes gene_type:complete